jgi:hypothetical protein
MTKILHIIICLDMGKATQKPLQRLKDEPEVKKSLKM